MRDILDSVRYIAMVFFYLFTIKYISSYSSEKIYLIIQRFAKIVLISLVFVSILGLIQYFSFSFFLDYFSPLYEKEFVNYDGRVGSTNFTFSYHTNRISSIYYTPIILGAFLVYYLAIIISSPLKKTPIIKALLSLGFLVLLLSNARAPLIAFSIGMLFYFFALDRRKGIWFLLSIVGAIILVLSLDFITSENIGRFEEILTFFEKGMNWNALPSTLKARIFDIGHIWSNFDLSKHLITGMPNKYYDTYLFGISFQSQYFSWLIKFGVFGVFLSGWLIYMFGKFYTLFKAEHDERSKKLFLMIAVLFLINVIMSISQQSALGARWREILFMLMGLVLVFATKQKQNMGTQVV